MDDEDVDVSDDDDKDRDDDKNGKSKNEFVFTRNDSKNRRALPDLELYSHRVPQA